jgi:hypothetical protein
MGARNPERDEMNLLGHLAGYELYGKCRCGQERRFAIAALAREYGGRTHSTQIGKRMVCGACGHKGIVLEKLRWDEKDPDDKIPY